MNAGSSLQCFNKDEETPLHVAAVRGYYTMLQFFCKSGANLNARDKVSQPASHMPRNRDTWVCFGGTSVILECFGVTSVILSSIVRKCS